MRLNGERKRNNCSREAAAVNDSEPSPTPMGAARLRLPVVRGQRCSGWFCSVPQPTQKNDRAVCAAAGPRLANYARVSSDTPNIDARTLVAAGVRFSFLAIFVRPTFCLASDFISRTSSLVHSRRTIFFFLAKTLSIFMRASFNTTCFIRNYAPLPACRGCSGKRTLKVRNDGTPHGLPD